MSLTLVKYPVTVESGITKNVFPGFTPVELKFKREDAAIVAVGSGVDAQITISIAGDITGSLNIGEWVYLSADGVIQDYDLSAKIVTVVFSSPNTIITIAAPFVEVSTVGYCNYKQNYFVESKLVNPDTNTILVYPSLLSDNGTPSGIIKVNASPIVDFLQNDIVETSKEVTSSRDKCKVMYREVWRENQTESFVLVDQTPIVIVYAADEINTEKFINDFEIPKVWKGYPFNLALLHSLENNVNKRYSVFFDELDINKVNINTDNPLFNFNPNDYGFMQVNFSDNPKILEDDTKFINFKIEENELADFLTGDFDDTDFFTINTP